MLDSPGSNDTLLFVAFRFDAFQLDAAKIQRTPSGGVRVDALLTRPGVFNYTDAQGKTVREYRPPEEVFAADSLASLADAAVTNRHPKGPVTADNWDKLAIGHVSNPRKEDSGVGAQVIIAKADAVRRVGTDLKELSCGYSVDLDFTPGTTPGGERYDAVQRNIRYNHVGAGPTGWGRQGPQSAMRLDSAGDQTGPEQEEKEHTEMIKLKVDGIVFEGETAEIVQAKVDSHFAAKGTSTLQTQLDAERGRADTLAKQVEAEKTRADAAPALAAASLAARAALETATRPALGAAFKFDGLSDRDIKVALVKRFDSAFSGNGADGQPLAEAYLDGVYATRLASAPTPGAQTKQDAILAGLGGVHASGARTDAAVGAVKNDGLDRANPSASAARAKMNERFSQPRPAASK